MRRAHDAIAEIQRFGTHGYRWVLDADIEAAFDNLSRSALLGRVRARVKDKRVLALVKAFLKARIRTLTSRTSQQPPRDALIRLNQIMRGWANYFKHAACKHTMKSLENFTWHRVIRWWTRLHRWKRKDVRRRLTGPHGRWLRPSAGGIELVNLAKVLIARTCVLHAIAGPDKRCQQGPSHP